jgi:hypothetical protein
VAEVEVEHEKDFLEVIGRNLGTAAGGGRTGRIGPAGRLASRELGRGSREGGTLIRKNPKGTLAADSIEGVLPVPLGEIGDARFEGADEISHARVGGPRPERLRPEVVAEGHADDLGSAPLRPSSRES